MKERNEPTKIVKGGFRATLALLFSIIAIILSVLAFNRTTSQTEYQIEITELKEKLDKMKQETAELVSKVRQETFITLKKMGIEIKKQPEKPENSEDSHIVTNE